MEVHRWNLEATMRPKVVAVIDEQQPGQESPQPKVVSLRRVIALQTGVDRITRQCHALSILG